MLTSTHLICVRHGETEWNAKGRIQGHLEIPLSIKGRAQAQALASALQDQQIHHIYASDLCRAVETAQPIATIKSLNINKIQQLREWHMGKFQGLTLPEIEAQMPEAYAKFRAGEYAFQIPGGESACEKDQRAVRCLEEIARKHQGQTCLVVTHGGLVTAFFQHCLGLPPGRPLNFRTTNAAINRFELTPTETGSVRWRLLTWGDEHHLKGLIRESTVQF